MKTPDWLSRFPALLFFASYAVCGGEFDPRYPAMAEWARAGVTGGIPDISQVSATASPGEDLQAKVDAVAAGGGGVIALEAGGFVLNKTLELRSGVVLRGAADGSTKLLLEMRGKFARERGDDGFSEWTCGVSGREVSRAGLERLTIVFGETLPPPPTLRTEKDAFINDPGGRDDLWVVSVRFTNCDDCWIRDCRIIDSGSHPILIDASRHVSVIDVEVSGAHNKGGKGAGYFNIARSEYTLVDGVTVRDIRHFAIQRSDEDFPCRYNVLRRSTLEVDVNFHNGDSGDNLVEDCVIAVPEWHWWPPISAGVPNQHRPPGPRNFIHRCRVSRTYPNPARNFTQCEDPGMVYVVIDDFARKDEFERNVRAFGPSPAGGALYVNMAR